MRHQEGPLWVTLVRYLPVLYKAPKCALYGAYLSTAPSPHKAPQVYLHQDALKGLCTVSITQSGNQPQQSSLAFYICNFVLCVFARTTGQHHTMGARNGLSQILHCS